MKRYLSAAPKWVVVTILAAAILGSWRLVTIRLAADLPSLEEILWWFWARTDRTLGLFEGTLVFLVKAAAVLALLWIGTRTVSAILRTRVLDRTALNDGRKFSLQRKVSYGLFAVGAMVGMDALGVDLSSLALIGGAFVIVLSRGFLPFIRDLASGLIMRLEQAVKTGDRVQVAEVQGEIAFMEGRGTWIRTKDNVLTIVPNSEFVTGRVTHWTVKDSNWRIKLPVAVARSSDPQHVRSVLLGAGRAHPDVLRDPAPDVVFAGFAEDSLKFELRVWTASRATSSKAISSDLYCELKDALAMEGIQTRLPQREFQLSSAAPAALDLPGTIWRIIDSMKPIQSKPNRQAKTVDRVGPPPVTRPLRGDGSQPQKTGSPNSQARTRMRAPPKPSE